MIFQPAFSTWIFHTMRGDTSSSVRFLLTYALLAITALMGSVDETHAAPPVMAQRPAVDADLLLKGGTIHDGNGGKPIVGDVAIRGDRIVAVGSFPVGKVDWTLDCRNLVIAPGFIDLHNHSDKRIADPKWRAITNYVTQGCTTIVTGNCGMGPVDVAEYYAKIDASGTGTNVAHLVPQGNLREEVMGTALREPTAEELNRMRDLTHKGMRDGAWGMSTGLIYVPSSYATIEELAEIAKVVAAEGGIYTSHIRGENVELLKAVGEALDIGRRAKLPVHISHFKCSGRDSWGLVRRAAEMIEEARKNGQVASADQYPYVASSTSLDATLVPTWARAGSRADLLARLDNPETFARIREAMMVDLKKAAGGEALVIARYQPRRDWTGKNLVTIAREQGLDPLDMAVEITRHGGADIVNFCMSEEDVRHVMQLPWVATASDGLAFLPSSDQPHPRSFGTFPRKLGHYSLKEGVLPLEQAIRSATGLPADILGLKDRGRLRVGLFADVVVFDPKTLTDRATYDNPYQFSTGVRYVFVNGQPAVYDSAPTGALAGRALRHGG